MIIARKIEELQRALVKKRNGEIGFVPTMGDLHEGHISLIRRSKHENDFTVVSIFVNPIQFNDKKDYQSYHRDEKRDIRILEREKTDVIFLPSARELYPEGFQTSVAVNSLSKNLCGKFRPGHFDGVATVVLKLLNVVQPAHAYFGMKDYQQCKIIERMVKDLNMPVAIVSCPTVREEEGMALSSRNRRLSLEELGRAVTLSSALHSAAHLIQTGYGINSGIVKRRFRGQLKMKKNDRIEYFEICRPDTLQPLKKITPPVLVAAAVWIGRTRLIDNILIDGTNP